MTWEAIRLQFDKIGCCLVDTDTDSELWDFCGAPHACRFGLSTVIPAKAGIQRRANPAGTTR